MNLQTLWRHILTDAGWLTPLLQRTLHLIGRVASNATIATALVKPYIHRRIVTSRIRPAYILYRRHVVVQRRRVRLIGLPLLWILHEVLVGRSKIVIPRLRIELGHRVYLLTELQWRV